uniref:J domain-containing protein n=1 Tax=viral metagenome TaxID=1070528 RepID=A0A6C0HGC9_9ZZZZ
MNSTENLYDVLGVDKSATQEDIKKAYRKLSLLHHPDRNNGSDESKTLFQTIQNAYEVLGTDENRKKYDQPQMFRQGGGQMNMNMNINPDEIFNFFSQNMFGGGGGMPHGVFMGGMPGGMAGGMPQFFNMENIRNGLMKPQPIIKNEEITLSKAYTGCTVPLQITRWLVENNTKREETETVYVTIPKGVDNNEIIIIREKGNSLADNNKGDIKLIIKIVNDTEFIRNGLDLILNKTITLKEALCGFSFDMKYIDGREFKLNNGNGNIIHNNYNKVIQHMGMKRVVQQNMGPVNQEHIGNLIINFNVAFPEKLTDEQIKSLTDIL